MLFINNAGKGVNYIFYQILFRIGDSAPTIIKNRNSPMRT